MENKIYAIIPARGGSKGVPDKNIKQLFGFPLLAYSIAAAKLCSQISRIIVSTDTDFYAKIARYFGAEVPFLRPKALSTDTSTDLEFMTHVVTWMKENQQEIPNYWVHLRPTTPLRQIRKLEEAIASFIQCPDATSLRSAHECPESPYKWFLLNNNFYEPLSKSMNSEMINLPRQQMPRVFIPDGYIDVLKTDVFMNSPSLHGEKILAYESPCCTEIDTLDDFNYLEYQLNNNHKYDELLVFLKNNFKMDVFLS